MKLHLPSVLALAGILLAVVPACSGDGETSRAADVSPEDDPAERLAKDSPLFAQLDEIIAVAAIITAAEDVHIESCMREAGFEFPSAGAPSQQEPSVAFNDLANWNPGEDGYAIPTNGEAGETNRELEEANRDFVELTQEEQEAYEKVFRGTEYIETDVGNGMTMSHPVGGCLGQASKEIASSTEAAVRFSTVATGISSLTAKIHITVLSDPTYVEAEQSWSICMSRDGFDDFFEPDDAEKYAQEELRNYANDGSDEPSFMVSEEERQLASVDKACRLEAELPSTFKRLYQAEEREVLASDEAQALLFEWNEIAEPVEAEARQTLAEAGIALTDDNN